MPAKQYKVILTDEERRQLLGLVSHGKAAAAKLTHARIVLQADQGKAGAAWGDAQISVALSVSRRTIERVRQTFVEDSLAAALQRRPPVRSRPKKLDGAKEAYLIALACSAPPDGRTVWTMQLLADQLVELQYVESISAETIRQTLKKTSSNPG